VDDGILWMSYIPSNHKLYVGNHIPNDLGYISIIDTTNTVTQTIPVGNNPQKMEFNPSNNNAYIPNFFSHTVSVIEATQPSNLKPIANAGSDKTERSGDIVQLNGTKSSANSGSPIAEYQWTQTEGPSVTLDDSKAVTPSFTAPHTDVPVNIVFELVVTNEDGLESEPDSVTITINPITPPIADAGPDQSVKSGEIVHLDGSNSSDPTSSKLTYSWSQVGGSPVAFSDSSSSNPTFTAPEINGVENLTFQLVVTNEEGISSEPDEVIITVNPITAPPEKPKTIHDILKGIIQNPLNVTNSIDSSNEIRNILTDGTQNNDKIVCDLVESDAEYASNIRDILNC
jgi:YVTN family beta-propeller protein